MKRRIGLSLYPDHSDYEEDREYLKKGYDLGFSRIFMSMLEVSEGKQAVANKFKKVIAYGKSLNYEVILDIAPSVFDQLEISYDDLSFFSELGADGLRLDVGFDGNKEALLTYNSQNLIIELNMSNDVAYLDNILTYKANKPFLYGCHNFYPQAGSALPLDFFVKCSQRFRKEGLKTAAFVSSQVGSLGPWDINDGLPTLEMHRYLPIEVQVKHMFATGLVDDVIIGNAYASDEELKKVSEVNRYQLELEVELNKDNSEVENEIVLDNQHFRRGDITENMVRSTVVRKKYGLKDNPAHDHSNEYNLGDVVVGNDDFGKYKNELQVILKNQKDSRKNLVGRIVEQEQFLIDYIQPWTKFKFKKKGE